MAKPIKKMLEIALVICRCCQREFDPPHFNSKTCSDACRLELRREAKRRYKSSEKGIEAEKRWIRSDKRAENEKRYRLKPQAKKKAVERSIRYLNSNCEARLKKRERDKVYMMKESARESNKRATKKYRQSEKGKIKRRLNKHARRVADSKGDFTFEQWKEILNLYNQSCAECGGKNNLEIDHIKPISKGGLHTMSNIQPLCRSCNAKKGAKWVS